MRIAFLSRYQKTSHRGAESFAEELIAKLHKDHVVDLLVGQDADDLSKILQGKYDVVVPLNGRLQSLKVSFGRIMSRLFYGHSYKILISGHSGIGRDDIWNIAIVKPDVFVALTSPMYKWAKKWAWGSKVVKISNGVNLDTFSPRGDRLKIDLHQPIVLSVGSLSWYKHHEKAMAAVSKLKDVSLLIVGRGEQQEFLQNLGKKILPNRFQIMTLPYDKMPQLYRSVNLFTLPSWDREAFGLVYLESLASNIPVVAPDDESRREIIEDAGIFVDVDDSNKFAKAIEEALAIDWENKPREQSEKFSWDIISKEYEKIFNDLVNQN